MLSPSGFRVGPSDQSIRLLRERNNNRPATAIMQPQVGKENTKAALLAKFKSQIEQVESNVKDINVSLKVDKMSTTTPTARRKSVSSSTRKSTSSKSPKKPTTDICLTEILTAFRENKSLAEQAIIFASRSGKLYPHEFRAFIRAFKSPSPQHVKAPESFDMFSPFSGRPMAAAVVAAAPPNRTATVVVQNDNALLTRLRVLSPNEDNHSLYNRMINVLDNESMCSFQQESPVLMSSSPKATIETNEVVAMALSPIFSIQSQASESAPLIAKSPETTVPAADDIGSVLLPSKPFQTPSKLAVARLSEKRIKSASKSQTEMLPRTPPQQAGDAPVSIAKGNGDADSQMKIDPFLAKHKVARTPPKLTQQMDNTKAIVSASPVPMAIETVDAVIETIVVSEVEEEVESEVEEITQEISTIRATESESAVTPTNDDTRDRSELEEVISSFTEDQLAEVVQVITIISDGTADLPSQLVDDIVPIVVDEASAQSLVVLQNEILRLRAELESVKSLSLEPQQQRIGPIAADVEEVAISTSSAFDTSSIILDNEIAQCRKRSESLAEQQRRLRENYANRQHRIEMLKVSMFQSDLIRSADMTIRRLSLKKDEPSIFEPSCVMEEIAEEVTSNSRSSYYHNNHDNCFVANGLLELSAESSEGIAHSPSKFPQLMNKFSQFIPTDSSLFVIPVPRRPMAHTFGDPSQCRIIYKGPLPPALNMKYRQQTMQTMQTMQKPQQQFQQPQKLQSSFTTHSKKHSYSRLSPKQLAQVQLHHMQQEVGNKENESPVYRPISSATKVTLKSSVKKKTQQQQLYYQEQPLTMPSPINKEGPVIAPMSAIVSAFAMEAEAESAHVSGFCDVDQQAFSSDAQFDDIAVDLNDSVVDEANHISVADAILNENIASPSSSSSSCSSSAATIIDNHQHKQHKQHQQHQHEPYSKYGSRLRFVPLKSSEAAAEEELLYIEPEDILQHRNDESVNESTDSFIEDAVEFKPKQVKRQRKVHALEHGKLKSSSKSNGKKSKELLTTEPIDSNIIEEADKAVEVIKNKQKKTTAKKAAAVAAAASSAVVAAVPASSSLEHVEKKATAKIAAKTKTGAPAKSVATNVTVPIDVPQMSTASSTTTTISATMTKKSSPAKTATTSYSRPKSSYAYFCDHTIAALRISHPTASDMDRANMCSQSWNKLSDEEKAMWVNNARGMELAVVQTTTSASAASSSSTAEISDLNMGNVKGTKEKQTEPVDEEEALIEELFSSNIGKGKGSKKATSKRSRQIASTAVILSVVEPEPEQPELAVSSPPPKQSRRKQLREITPNDLNVIPIVLNDKTVAEKSPAKKKSKAPPAELLPVAPVAPAVAPVPNPIVIAPIAPAAVAAAFNNIYRTRDMLNNSVSTNSSIMSNPTKKFVVPKLASKVIRK